MKQNNDGKEIYYVTSKIIKKLSVTITTPSGKSILASLRNSIGKPPSQTIEIWSILFEYLPKELLSVDGNVTDEELVIITTLQLFATHQQGKSESVQLLSDRKISNIGSSFRILRELGAETALDRRFNSLITSNSFEEISHHLRQIIKLLKSKTSAKIDYSKLAEDLYWFKRGYQENIRLSWARAYYQIKEKGEELYEEQ